MLENAIGKIDDGIIISEISGKNRQNSVIKYINNAFKKIIGNANLNFNSETNIRNKLALPIYHKEIEEKFKNPKYPLILEYEIKRPVDNKIIFISEKVFNYSENMFLSVIRDTTSLEKEKEIRTLLEHTLKDHNDVIWVRKLNSNELIYVSDSVTKLTGYPAVCFKNEVDFWQKTCVHPDDRNTYKKYRNTDTWPRTLQYRIIDTSGNIKWIETILFYKNEQKNIYRAVDRDITEQIKSEVEKQNQVRIDIAQKMIQHNIDPSIISDSTGLSCLDIKHCQTRNVQPSN